MHRIILNLKSQVQHLKNREEKKVRTLNLKGLINPEHHSGFLTEQQAAEPEQAVIWDYHVILLSQIEDQYLMG